MNYKKEALDGLRPYSPCIHLIDNHCTMASWMADKECPTTPEMCKACSRCSKPRDVNEVTLALAGIKESAEGPGTTLHNIITWFIPQPPGCSCPNRVALMNAWGKERCLKELPTILSWLRESALDNNYPYSEYVISAVVKTILTTSKWSTTATSKWISPEIPRCCHRGIFVSTPLLNVPDRRYEFFTLRTTSFNVPIRYRFRRKCGVLTAPPRSRMVIPI